MFRILVRLDQLSWVARECSRKAARLGLSAHRLTSVPNPFPSLKARAMLAILQGKLGYEIQRQSGSHRRLAATGRPSLTFAFHDSASLAPGEVRDILVKQVGLDRDQALRLVQ